MFACPYTIRAMDPIWFRGLGLTGNAWDYRILHATALNYALLPALGFRSPHIKYASLGIPWSPHSMPYPSFPLWMTPGRIIPGTARPIQVFRGGRSGESIQILPPADPAKLAEESARRGFSSGWRAEPKEDGSFTLKGGSAPPIGKPFLTTGYMGEWEGILFAKNQGGVDLLLTEAGPFGIRLGPNRVLAEVNLGEITKVQPYTAEAEEFADHLIDPFLLSDETPVYFHHAKPYPVAECAPTGIAGDLRVHAPNWN